MQVKLKFWLIGGLLVAVFVGAAAYWYFVANRKPANLEAQLATMGAIDISVTPMVTADSYEFEISLNTHSVELNFDLAVLSVLSNEVGQTLKATDWQGDPVGGHHREGKLIFSKFDPKPKKLILTIDGVAGKKASFIWDL